MPKTGSENQIEPSDAQTMSFGELKRLPSKRSARTVIDPSYSVRVMRRARCSQAISRPWRSRASPLEWFDGWRKTERPPVVSSQRRIRLLGMSLNSR